jgi:hypothetical protein
MPQVGILVVEDIAIEARINFETALREHGVSTETTVLEFSTGSGAGLAVTIIAAIAGVVSILKNGPDAWENSKNGVRKIIAILRKMMASESLDCDLNVESLKLICIGVILDEHPELESLEPRLISASMATDPDPEKPDEEDILGPVHILVPLPQMAVTHVFAVDWKGDILARSTIPYIGPSITALEVRRQLRARQERLRIAAESESGPKPDQDR